MKFAVRHSIYPISLCMRLLLIASNMYNLNCQGNFPQALNLPATSDQTPLLQKFGLFLFEMLHLISWVDLNRYNAISKRVENHVRLGDVLIVHTWTNEYEGRERSTHRLSRQALVPVIESEEDQPRNEPVSCTSGRMMMNYIFNRSYHVFRSDAVVDRGNEPIGS